MKLKIQTVIAMLALLLLLTTAAAAEAAEGHFSRTLQVPEAAKVSVQTGSGTITVRQGAGGTVRVNANIHARDNWFGRGGMSARDRVAALEKNPPIQQVGNIISIGKIDDPELRRNVSIDYDVEVPATTQLNSSSGSGDVSVRGLNGYVKATTGSGSVKISEVKGEVRAQTGSGDVELEQISGPRCNAETGSGSITARGVAGEFSGQTGSGDVTMDQSSSGDVNVSTGSGNIRLRNVKGGVRASAGSGDLEIAGEPSSAWRIETGSGTVELTVPQQAAFDVDARTSSGSVSTSHPLTVQGTTNPRTLRGKVRGGGALMAVSTGSGDIRIN